MSSSTPVPKKMKVADLRTELDKRGLPTTGLRAELVHRLEAALDEEEFGADISDMPETSNTEYVASTKNSVENGTNKIPPASLNHNSSTTRTEFKRNLAISGSKSASAVSSLSSNGNSSTNVASKEDVNKVDVDSTKLSSALTEEEKMKKRKERFAMIDNDEEKLAKRCARFGVDTPKLLEIKKQERAERFKETLKENSETKLRQQRAERFGVETVEKLEAKKKEREMRFLLDSKLKA